jgi:N-terminal acetyltransferase B complex catalytic subunit
VDLFVRTTNTLAIGMYEQLGYSVYRRVKDYYHASSGNQGGEDQDAFGIVSLCSWLIKDMRKAMKQDTLKQSVRENGRNFIVTPDEVMF